RITAALPGVAFQLALSAVTPLLGQKAEWAKSLETFITNARINSCETATALVRGAANQVGFDAFSSCVRIAIELGLEPDEDGARRRCRYSQDATLAAGAASGNADARAMVPFTGNLTWQALKRVNSIDDSERELILSMVGTVVYYPTSQNRDPDVMGPTLTSITQLLYGNADAGSGNVTITLLKCSDFTDCTGDAQNTGYVLKPFTTKAEEIMRSISDKIATRSLAPTPSEIGFVNITSEPVYRMLSIGNAIKGSGLAETLIIKYRDVVAVDYAYNFLERSLKTGLDALAKDFKLDTRQTEIAKELRDRVRGYLTALALEKQAHYAKVQAIAIVAFCGFVTAALAYAFMPHKLIGWQWLASVLLVYSILFVPKVTVGIVDKLGTQPVQVVSNVPFGVAFFGNLTSTIGNTLTEVFETAFQTLPGPAQQSADLTYQRHSVMFGNTLIKRTRQIVFDDPNFRTDLV